MKLYDISVSDKLVAATLIDFISYLNHSQSTEDQLEFYAEQNGAKKSDEVLVASTLAKDILNHLAGAVDKQGPEKVLKTLQQMIYTK